MLSLLCLEFALLCRELIEKWSLSWLEVCETGEVALAESDDVIALAESDDVIGRADDVDGRGGIVMNWGGKGVMSSSVSESWGKSGDRRTWDSDTIVQIALNGLV